MSTKKTKSKYEVRCHVHGETIKVDCHLPQCLFHTGYPGVKQCMLVYLAKHNAKSFKALDIGMLKRVPEADVTKALSKAMLDLRSETLKISHYGSVDRSFITLMDRKICYNCEKPITPKVRKKASRVRLPRTDHKIWYCSSKCQNEYPPQWVTAEMECQNDIKTIVAWAVRKYSTLGGLEQALGMNRKLLGHSLDVLLGIDADNLYPTTKRVKTRSKSLVRRTGSKPEWLNKFYEDMAPLREKMTEKYGPVSIDLTKLKNELNTILRTI